MQRRIKQVFSSVREHTCVSYAKIATIGGFCDIDIVIVKATSPDDLPLPERYVTELLKIFSISPSSFRAFSLSFIRRFGKTQCWRVALKCLVLLHRLLRSLPDDSPFRTELLWTRANGLLSLYPCHFQDCSSSYSEDYTSFIRSYAQLLDEALSCLSNGIKKNEQEEPETIPDKIKEVERMVQFLPQLQSLIDRVMDCQPTGAAARSFIVQSAMKYVIRDSFKFYTTFRNEIVVVLDNLIPLPYRSCLAAFDIYKKAASQASQLYEFYDWCKSMGFCGLYEYPFVDRIPQIQIEALEAFLNGMWQLSSSSTMSPIGSTLQSPLSLTEDDTDKALIKSDIVSTDKKGQFGAQTSGYVLGPEKDQTQFGVYSTDDWAKFDELESNKGLEKDKEMDPLIQFEVDNVGWEALLEASIKPSCIVSENNFYFHPNECGHDYQYGNSSVNALQMQIYKPRIPHALNPFQQPCNTPIHYGSFSSNTTYAWGL